MVTISLINDMSPLALLLPFPLAASVGALLLSWEEKVN
jgi:hypothetical protein